MILLNDMLEFKALNNHYIDELEALNARQMGGL